MATHVPPHGNSDMSRAASDLRTSTSEYRPARAPKPNLLDRIVQRSKELLGRGREPIDLATRFVWNPERLPGYESNVVICVDLPVADPALTLLTYVRAGIQPDHVVFVGDSTSLADDAYDAITQKGALVHHTRPDAWNAKKREQTEEDLAAYFDAHATAEPRYVVKNEYTYTPAPRKVSPDEFQEFLNALAMREQR